MSSKKPLIKNNNGKPIALCNACFCIMCYVSCPEGEDLDGNDNCVVIERLKLGSIEHIKTPIGQKPPVYCSKCNKFLKGYFLN